MLGQINRRRFLRDGLAAAPLSALLPNGLGEEPTETRLRAATDLRVQTATFQGKRPLASMRSNDDERSLPLRIGCFSKGLPQNQFGEVQPAAYNALLAALKSETFEAFEKLPRSGGRRLSNPQCAYAFSSEGGDPHTFDVGPAPSIASEKSLFDCSEIYWQAACRDVPFSAYASSSIVKTAAMDLGVTTDHIFRGTMQGALAGPYVSQFLLKPIPYGSAYIQQRYNAPIAKSDFMTAFSEWSQLQTGLLPWLATTYDDEPRYIRNGRDLAEYVHYDFANQAYLSAALILINANAKSIHNCNQFKSGSNPYRYSTVEEGFVTFGPAEAVDWIGRVTTAALKAAYFQKWCVHRRLRPEALGGLIHLTRTGKRSYPIHKSLLQAAAVDAVFETTGTYLLPQAYPEGCPIHPSYPSGHAAIAGACSVILKACFDGSMLLPECVQPDQEGLSLVPCTAYFPTITQEIDKLAFNIAMGRDWAGIHFNSDTTAGLALGEAVGISVLQDMARTYSEKFNGFHLTRFDGSSVTIKADGGIDVA